MVQNAYSSFEVVRGLHLRRLLSSMEGPPTSAHHTRMFRKHSVQLLCQIVN